MSNTFSNRPSQKFDGRLGATKKRPRVKCAWGDAQRGNRRGVRIALTRGDWDRAMDIGAPTSSLGELR